MYQIFSLHGTHAQFKSTGKERTTIPILLTECSSECLQVYFGGQIGWNRKSFSDSVVIAAVQSFEECNKRMYVHACLSSHLASQTITRIKKDNPCHKKPKKICDGCYRDGPFVHECTRRALESELQYIHKFRAASVIHPGSGTGTSSEICSVFTERLNDMIIPTSHFGMKTLLLENSAGQGKTIGRSWEEYRYIFEELDDTTNISIVIDTCHTYAASMCMFDTADSVIKLFEDAYDLLGHHIPMIHLNGSKIESDINNPCNKDRHACLMNFSTVMVSRTRKKKKVLVEESVTDYIWCNRNYNMIIPVRDICIIKEDRELKELYDILKQADNFEGLEELVRQSKDHGTDLISETEDYVTDNAIISCIANNME